MDSLIFYWELTLIVLVVLIMLTDVGTASIITTFMVVIKYIMQPYSKKNMFSTRSCFENEKKGVITTASVNQSTGPKVKTSASVSKKLPVLKPEVMVENAELLEDVLHPSLYSADDKIFNASVVSGYKEKKAKEIRSHWNNNNWKKYYDYEMGVHEEENRDWWTDDDFELSKKHVVI